MGHLTPRGFENQTPTARNDSRSCLDVFKHELHRAVKPGNLYSRRLTRLVVPNMSAEVITELSRLKGASFIHYEQSESSLYAVIYVLPSPGRSDQRDDEEIVMLLRLIARLATVHYHFDPRLNRSPVVSTIQQALEERHFLLERDTVRKWLRIACALGESAPLAQPTPKRSQGTLYKLFLGMVADIYRPSRAECAIGTLAVEVHHDLGEPTSPDVMSIRTTLARAERMFGDLLEKKKS